MNRSVSLGMFFTSAIVWFIGLTVLWLQLSAWISYPVATITHVVLEHGAKDWVRKVKKDLGKLEAETRVVISVPEQGRENRRGELIVEVDPSHYAYGLPLFLALLLASRSQRLIRRALAGYLVLLIPQAFSLVLDILKQIEVAAGGAAPLGMNQWQMEAIALGYQFGSLLLPTLAPIALWLYLDRVFVAGVIVEGMLRNAAKA